MGYTACMRGIDEAITSIVYEHTVAVDYWPAQNSVLFLLHPVPAGTEILTYPLPVEQCKKQSTHINGVGEGMVIVIIFQRSHPI